MERQHWSFRKLSPPQIYRQPVQLVVKPRLKPKPLMVGVRKFRCLIFSNVSFNYKIMLEIGRHRNRPSFFDGLREKLHIGPPSRAQSLDRGSQSQKKVVSSPTDVTYHPSLRSTSSPRQQQDDMPGPSSRFGKMFQASTITIEILDFLVCRISSSFY